jgi:hypothetical protein
MEDWIMESSGKQTHSSADNKARAALETLSLPLQECGEIAALRLSGALADALSQAEVQLMKEAGQALTPRERDDFLDAADLARVHRRSLAHDFMKHFEQRYVRACQRKNSALLGHVIDFDVKELRIVEHHVLDESLEPGLIAEAIQNASWKTLQALASHFRELLKSQDLLPNDIPLGPKLIEAATADAIRDQPWRHRSKHRLVRALRWGLAARVNLLYRDLVDHLNASDLRSSAPAKEKATRPEPQRSAAVEQPKTLWQRRSEAATSAVVPSSPEVVTDHETHQSKNIADAPKPMPEQVMAAVPGQITDMPSTPATVAPVATAEAAAAPTAAAPPEKALPDSCLEGLTTGTWLEYTEPGKTPSELKLAWISPRKSLYLLTNKQGERALSLKAVDFARLITEGQVRVMPTAQEAPVKGGAEAKHLVKKTA